MATLRATLYISDICSINKHKRILQIDAFSYLSLSLDTTPITRGYIIEIFRKAFSPFSQLTIILWNNFDFDLNKRKSTSTDSRDKNVGENVVKNNIFHWQLVYSFFSSIELAEHLWQNKLAKIGTLRKKTKRNPSRYFINSIKIRQSVFIGEIIKRIRSRTDQI